MNESIFNRMFQDRSFYLEFMQDMVLLWKHDSLNFNSDGSEVISSYKLSCVTPNMCKVVTKWANLISYKLYASTSNQMEHSNVGTPIIRYRNHFIAEITFLVLLYHD